MLPGLAHPPPVTQVVRRIEAIGTSYCPDRYSGSRTATGTKPAPGTAAVDPRVIPLHTYFLVNGTIWESLDTGGDVKGARVDLWSDDCKASWLFGRRRVTVLILGNPPMHEYEHRIAGKAYHDTFPASGKSGAWKIAAFFLGAVLLAFFVLTRRERS